MTHSLQQGHSYPNKTTVPNNATPVPQMNLCVLITLKPPHSTLHKLITNHKLQNTFTLTSKAPIVYQSQQCLFLFCFVLVWCFLRQGFFVALESVFELTLVDQADLKLTEICPSLPPECWD